jgi:hypothetical protein
MLIFEVCWFDVLTLNIKCHSFKKNEAAATLSLSLSTLMYVSVNNSIMNKKLVMIRSQNGHLCSADTHQRLPAVGKKIINCCREEGKSSY